MIWTKEKAYRVRALIEQAMSRTVLTDAEASEASMMFPAWDKLLAEGKVFAQEDVDSRYRLRYGDQLYAVTQPHTVQADWTPDAAVSMYEPIDYRDGYRIIGEYITAANPFSAGEEGIDADGVIWVSRVDDNVYTPTQYPDNWERKEADA